MLVSDFPATIDATLSTVSSIPKSLYSAILTSSASTSAVLSKTSTVISSNLASLVNVITGLTIILSMLLELVPVRVTVISLSPKADRARAVPFNSTVVPVAHSTSLGNLSTKVPSTIASLVVSLNSKSDALLVPLVTVVTSPSLLDTTVPLPVTTA